MKTCKDCKFFHRNLNDPLNKDSNICLRYPPTVHIGQIQTPLGNHSVTISSYPGVTEKSPTCGEFEPVMSDTFIA